MATIPNYRPPRLRTRLLLAPNSLVGTRRLQAVVVGPNYQLSRYGVEETPSDAFASAGSALSYRYVDSNGTTQTKPATWTVDQDFVKLHGKDLEAQYAAFVSGGSNIYVDSLSELNVLRLAGSSNFAGTSLHATLLDRAVKVGDLVVVDDGTYTYRRKVTGLRGRAIAATYGSNAGTDNDTHFANASGNPATSAAAAAATVLLQPANFSLTVPTPADFDGLARGAIIASEQLYGEVFTLTVRSGGAPGVATFDVTSSTGLYNAINVPSVDDDGDYSITNAATTTGELAGLNVLIEKTSTPNLVAGQVFQFKVTKPYTRLSATQVDGSDTGSGYLGTKNTTYVIEVLTGGALGTATVRITDTKQLETPVTLTPAANTDFAVGTYGLLCKFNFTSAPTQAGLRAGDKYYINAKAATLSTTEFNRLVLDGPAVNGSTFNSAGTALNAKFREVWSGSIAAELEASASADGKAGNASGPSWSTTATALNVASGLALYMDGRSSGNEWVAFVNGQGTLHASWRAALPVTSSTKAEVLTSLSDVTAKFGTIDNDNDLAAAAAAALTGAQGNQIFGLATGGTSAAAYTAALKRIKATDQVYTLAILSYDLDVQQAALAHVLEMSSETNQRYRKMYAGVQSPGTYKVLDEIDGETATATITNSGGQFVLVTFAEDAGLTGLGIETGDRLLLPGSDEEYEIYDVLSDTELQLVAGPTAAVTIAVPVEVWRADSPSSQMDYVTARARSLNSYRANLIWSESGSVIGADGVEEVPLFVAVAEYAGARSAAQPQQGLSRMDITSFSNAPAMYTKYEPSDLDLVASQGVTILTQDMEDTSVYVRHQLTTKGGSNPLEYEDNITVVLDFITYQFNDALLPFVGKRNANDATVAEIRTKVANILMEATKGEVNDPLGPMLSLYQNLEVYIDPQMPDRIVVEVDVNPTLPLNEILVTITASVALATT